MRAINQVTSFPDRLAQITSFQNNGNIIILSDLKPGSQVRILIRPLSALYRI